MANFVTQAGNNLVTQAGNNFITQTGSDVLTETLVPTSDVGTPTNATGTFANVDEGVDAASDGTFIAPTDTSLAMVKRLAYPALTAGRTLVTGAGLQKVRVKAWKTPGVNTTTLTVTIKEAGGAVLATPINAVSVTNESGEIVTGTFDATVLADNTAADIETEITTAPGSP